jgi:hypothetical protein
VSSSIPPDRVPTLTEVVAWPESPPYASPPEAPPVEADVMTDAVPVASHLSEAQLVQRVLGEVQRQVDLMLDYRLREVLTPLLTRNADAMVREARAELATTLRDIVARAVAQELARHRNR